MNQCLFVTSSRRLHIRAGAVYVVHEGKLMHIRTPRLLAMVASLAAAASLVSAGGASAAEGEQPRGALIGTLSADDTAAPPKSAQIRRERVDTNIACNTIAPTARAGLGGAAKACVEIKPLADFEAPPTADHAVAANDACDITQPGYATATRFGTCLNGMEITYTLLNDKNAVVGTGLMNVATSMTLSATKTTWNETATVKVISVTGQVKSLNISYDVGCTGGCSMTDARPWDGTKTLGVGGTATGTVTYNTPLASGGLANVTSKHHMYVVASGTIPVQPNVSWDNPWPIRCDNQVGANPGCVVPDVRANFEFSLAELGGAAATYGWAQNALRDGAPLRRDPSEATAKTRREYTCGSKSTDPFIYMDDVVPNDSCDEFPFARSYEGGTNGALCADIVPLYENGQWMIYEARADKPVTGNEPCARGHVNNDDNSNAGLALGRYVQRDRVLDTEKYNVYVTN
ncbi:NucA/NucB deoxyribonuclease domain-containing protein [Streptomyces milbemycinicus]|uniref:Deoxyribonuclease NucA/NucB domain-containing protein n=1 Tax=Streptomyces milbemycinicus TaxID=476552 RepID=A0ABW8M315_9ACTN